MTALIIFANNAVGVQSQIIETLNPVQITNKFCLPFDSALQ